MPGGHGARKSPLAASAVSTAPRAPLVPRLRPRLPFEFREAVAHDRFNLPDAPLNLFSGTTPGELTGRKAYRSDSPVTDTRSAENIGGVSASYTKNQPAQCNASGGNSAFSDGAAIQRALVGCRDENHPKDHTRHGRQDRGFAQYTDASRCRSPGPNRAAQLCRTLSALGIPCRPLTYRVAGLGRIGRAKGRLSLRLSEPLSIAGADRCVASATALRSSKGSRDRSGRRRGIRRSGSAKPRGVSAARLATWLGQMRYRLRASTHLSPFQYR